MNTDYNPTDLAAIEEQRIADAAQSKFEAGVELDDIRWLLSGKRGRRIMWRLLADGRIYKQSFDGNANWAIFNEGKRSIALKLMAQIHSIDGGAELYAQMATEAKVKDKPNG